MIILIGSNKGGSGKTTIACNLAIALAKHKNDVCLVDADRQGSSARWHQEREAADIAPLITLVQKYDNLTKTLQSLNDKFDVVLVDVAGRNSREMITAAGHYRKSYRDVISEGLTVLEGNNKQAAEEITSLYNEVFHNG